MICVRIGEEDRLELEEGVVLMVMYQKEKKI
jgi:hypothetical protein